jgi:hypothetical protein
MRHFAFLLSLLLALPAYAKAPLLEPLPEIPPPPGMVTDPALEPQITIKSRDGDRVEEFRVKGRLYMIKVTPAHGRPYFLIDQRGDGTMTRHDDLTAPLQVPMWVIHSF